jgi:hypothetical protein
MLRVRWALSACDTGRIGILPASRKGQNRGFAPNWNRRGPLAVPVTSPKLGLVT